MKQQNAVRAVGILYIHSESQFEAPASMFGNTLILRIIRKHFSCQHDYCLLTCLVAELLRCQADGVFEMHFPATGTKVSFGNKELLCRKQYCIKRTRNDNNNKTLSVARKLFFNSIFGGLA